MMLKITDRNYKSLEIEAGSIVEFMFVLEQIEEITKRDFGLINKFKRD